MKQTIGLLGRKIGMTRIFTDDGAAVPVPDFAPLFNRKVRVVGHCLLLTDNAPKGTRFAVELPCW